MGNHFRTSGDEQSARPVQAPTTGTASDPVATPDMSQRETLQADLFSEQAAPAAHFAPASSAPNPVSVPSPQDPGVTNPALTSIPDPSVAPATPAPSQVPDPFAPATPAPSQVPAPDVFMTSAGPAVASTDANEARQVNDLNAALSSPEFTSVFAPLRDTSETSRKQQAREAGLEPVILTEHLTKVYPAQPNKPALDDVNIEIYPGEFVFLVGHSGSGKTTLLNTLLRNVKPTSGRVLVAGQDLMKIKNRKVPLLRRQIGAVFQDYKLLPNKTAYENVAFALQCIGKPRGVIRAQVPEVLRLVGLAEQMDSLPDQLSGGEQQRVSVARAMVNRPPLLICDEPTGNLDPAISLGIMKLLERINKTGTTVIVATHDREMIDSMHRRVIALEGGRVVRDQERGGYGNYGRF